MAGWESGLPIQKRRQFFQQGRVCVTQDPQRDATALIQALQKELIFNDPKSTSFNSTSQLRVLSNNAIHAFADGFLEESASLHPLISFSGEHIDIPTNTSFLLQAPHVQESEDLIGSSETSTVLGMESASESIHDFSSAPSKGLLPSTSLGRWSSFSSNVNFQSSLGMDTFLNNRLNLQSSLGMDHTLNNRLAMASTSRACRPEFLDSHLVTLTAPGAPPSSNVAALDAPSSVGAGGKRIGRKRSRASRGPPTTILEVDCSNFRAMVQQLTGMIPSSPFLSSSLQHSRFEQLGPHHGLVRPQPTRPTAFSGQSSFQGISRLHCESLHKADPTSLYVSRASTYGDLPKSNEVTPYTFVSKPLDLDHLPNSAMDFPEISEESTSHLNPSSVFQPLDYPDMVALLSARDHSPSHVLADESQLWDSKVDQSMRSISFDDLSNIKLVSTSKKDCCEEQFQHRAKLDRHTIGLDIISSNRTSGHIVDSWFSQAD